jgi:inhibitor of cysteine peptidase
MGRLSSWFAVTVFLVFGAVLARAQATGPAANGVTIVDEKAAGDVTLKVGGRLEVHLAANHTTGYSWVQVPVEKPVLQKQGKAVYHENPANGAVGVGGVEVWKFKAVKQGTQKLKFEYRRPSERAPHPEKTLSFDVTVQ